MLAGSLQITLAGPPLHKHISGGPSASHTHPREDLPVKQALFRLSFVFLWDRGTKIPAVQQAYALPAACLTQEALYPPALPLGVCESPSRGPRFHAVQHQYLGAGALLSESFSDAVDGRFTLSFLEAEATLALGQPSGLFSGCGLRCYTCWLWFSFLPLPPSIPPTPTDFSL